MQVVGRAGEADALAGQPAVMQRVLLGQGSATTLSPLTVLVDSSSASASEILAGSLKDNGRATIIGDSQTYGKGKIQSVFDLSDGSALFVTVARYKTPALPDIDRIGIKADAVCGPPGRERTVVLAGAHGS